VNIAPARVRVRSADATPGFGRADSAGPFAAAGAPSTLTIVASDDADEAPDEPSGTDRGSVVFVPVVYVPVVYVPVAFVPVV
jgi:hypothetical protein